jgi:hypothetical protein
VKRIAAALIHPVRQRVAGEPAQLHFAVSRMALGLGQLVGAAGVTMRHH